MTTELDTATFDATVKRESRPVLVDFWAPWCGPCRAQNPILERLASQSSDRYLIAKVNVDDHQELAARFNISSIPTLLLFKKGELVRRFRGLQSEEALRSALREASDVEHA